MSRPQRNVRRKKQESDNEEGECGQSGRGGGRQKDTRGGKSRTPPSSTSPYAKRERRSRHFGDDEVGGMAALIPKSRKAESVGKISSKGSAASPNPRGRPRKIVQDHAVPGSAKHCQKDEIGEQKAGLDDEVEDENEDRDDAGEEGEGEEDEEDEEDEGTEESEEAKGEIEGTAVVEEGDDIEDEAKDPKHKEDACEEPRMPVSAAVRPQKEVIHAAAPDWNHKSTSNATQSTAAPASPAITAMAAVAAAATVAAAMAQAHKDMSPHVNAQDKIGAAGSGAADSLAAALQADASGASPQASQAMAAAAAAVAAAAAAGVSPAVSQAMLQGATPGGGGGPGGGLVPVGWAAQGMAGAMAGLGAHQLAMQKWARMAGLPMPGNAEADKTSGHSPAGLLQGAGAAGWPAMQQYASLATPPIPATKGTAGPGPSQRVSYPHAAYTQQDPQHVHAQQHAALNARIQTSLLGAPPPLQAAGRAPARAAGRAHPTPDIALDDKRLCNSLDGGPRKLVMWTSVDDALLKSAIEGGMSLSDIAAHVPFTSDFSVRDLEVRWRALLYDPVVSMEVAVELAALAGGKRVNLLHKRRSQGESPRDGADMLRASAARAFALPPATAAHLLQQGVTSDKVSGSVTVLEERAADPAVRASSQCLAAVDGANSHYLIFKSIVVVGRRPKTPGGKGAEVDVDLSLEGNAAQVSRQQALIRRDIRGVWWLENVGQGEVYVNGSLVQRLASCELPGKVLLVFSGIRLTFDRL